MLVGLAVIWIVVGLWMVVLVPWDYPDDAPRFYDGDGRGGYQLSTAGIALFCAAWPIVALGWLCGVVTISRNDGGE